MMYIIKMKMVLGVVKKAVAAKVATIIVVSVIESGGG